MLKKQVLKLADFSGGLNTKSSEIALNPNQSPDCVNVHSDVFKSLKKRNGYAKLNSSTAGGTAWGVYNYLKNESTEYLVGLWDTTLKKMDVVTSAWDGTWDTVSKDANRGTALSGNYMYNTTFNGDCIITTESQNVPQKYDPSDADGYTDLDWETSHCYVVGDDASITTGTGAYLKLTIDGTEFDDIDVRSKTTVAGVVTAINAHTGLAAKGIAVADSLGYLRVYSNTRGSSGSVVVADGTSDSGDAQGEATEVLFSGTTQTGTTIGTNIAPSAKYSTVWNDYVWMANVSSYPDRLQRSAASDHTTWSAIDYNDIITPGDVGITGMRVLRGRLYIFKRYSIHRVTYLGGTPLIQIQEVRSGMGCASTNSIRTINHPTEGELLVYLGTDMQLYKFNGYTCTPLSEVISTYNSITTYCMFGDGSTYGINPATLSKCHADDYVSRHWYVLFFCKDDDTSPKDAIVFDYFANSFWPFHFDEDGSDVFTTSCIADNGAGQRKLYVSGYNGSTYHTWLFDTTNADDGGNIDAKWVSSKLDLGSEVTMKQLRNITMTTSSSAATPIYNYRCDWESGWSDSETMAASTNEHTYDIPRFEELFQFKISDDSTTVAFELIRASIIASVEGQAK